MNNFTVNNEKALLKKVAGGDEAAFAELFNAYHNKLGAYIYGFTASKEATKDIVQEVFLKIWLNRKKLATISRFGTYVYVLSRNHTLNYLRDLAGKRVKEKEAKKILEGLPSIVEMEERAPDPDYYQLMDQAVEKLPPQQQKVYILSYRKRLKYKEIAQQMGISHETVKKYLKLARYSITNYVRSHSDLLFILFFLSFHFM